MAALQPIQEEFSNSEAYNSNSIVSTPSSERYHDTVQSAADLGEPLSSEPAKSPRLSFDHPSPGAHSDVTSILHLNSTTSITIPNLPKDSSSPMGYDMLASPAAPSLREFGPQMDHAASISRSSSIFAAEKHLSALSVLSASSPVIPSNPAEVERILKLYGIQPPHKVEQDLTSSSAAAATNSSVVTTTTAIPASPTHSLNDKPNVTATYDVQTGFVIKDEHQIDSHVPEYVDSPCIRIRGVKSSFSSFSRGMDSATSARGLPPPQRNYNSNGRKSPAVASPSSCDGTDETATASTNCILSNFYDFDNGQCGYDKCDCGDWAAFMSRTIAEMSQPDYTTSDSSPVPTLPRKSRKSKPPPLDLSRISAKKEKKQSNNYNNNTIVSNNSNNSVVSHTSNNNSISSNRSKSSSNKLRKSSNNNGSKVDAVVEIGKNIKAALGERSNMIDFTGKRDSKPFIKYDLSPSPTRSSHPLHPLTIELAKRDLEPKQESLDDRNQATFFAPSNVKRALLRPVKSFRKLRIVA